MRTLLLLFTIFLGACSSVPRAPELPSETGYLPQRLTRKLVEHWSAKGYPAEVSGRPIRLLNRHPAIQQISTLTPARDFAKDDNNKKHLGTVAMLHHKDSPSGKPITETAWQFTSQPGTLVGRSEKDGSVTLTAFDFRDQKQLDGYSLAQNHELSFDYAEHKEDSPLASFFSLINPTKWSNRRGFYLATEYNPEKIPLIFIHGLLSTPFDFKKLAARIAAEEDLWDRYQFWYYFYPSGDPWVISAAHFRSDFRALTQALDPDKNDRPLRQETTLIAHSMGGLISRLSVSEQSERLYQQYFTQSLSKVNYPHEQKKRLRQQFLFKPLTEPKKIIFLATPNQGSGLARGPLSWLAKGLIRKPANILRNKTNPSQGKEQLPEEALTKHGMDLLNGRVQSVTGLRSDSVALQALNEMPVRKGVELHNIVATLTGTKAGFGDWVVPYKSARLSRANSETVIRGTHWLIHSKKTATVVIGLLR